MLHWHSLHDVAWLQHCHATLIEEFHSAMKVMSGYIRIRLDGLMKYK